MQLIFSAEVSINNGYMQPKRSFAECPGNTKFRILLTQSEEYKLYIADVGCSLFVVQTP